MALTRDDILKSRTFEVTKKRIEALDDDVYLRELNALHLTEFARGWEELGLAEQIEKAAESGEGLQNVELPVPFVAKTCARMMCDENGKRLFRDEDVEDLMDRLDLKTLVELFTAGLSLLQVTQDDLEGLEKK